MNSSARTDARRAASLEGAIDLDRIALTIEQATARRAALPPYEELADLEQLLRGHIGLLLPIVQEHTNGMHRGSAAWEQRQATLDSVRRQLNEDMGQGLLSANAHVHELGRSCRFLLDYYRRTRLTGGDRPSA